MVNFGSDEFGTYVRRSKFGEDSWSSFRIDEAIELSCIECRQHGSVARFPLGSFGCAKLKNCNRNGSVSVCVRVDPAIGNVANEISLESLFEGLSVLTTEERVDLISDFGQNGVGLSWRT